METGTSVQQSPLVERKNKMSVISRLFKPWTWNLNRKKPSEKIQKQCNSKLTDFSVKNYFYSCLFQNFAARLFLFAVVCAIGTNI